MSGANPTTIPRRPCGLNLSKRKPLEKVDRVWRGIVMDSYSIEKFTGWTPLSIAAAGVAAVRLALAGVAF